MKKHRFDLTVLAALATIVLAVLVATEPAWRDRSFHIYALVLAGLLLIGLVAETGAERRPSAFAAALSVPGRPESELPDLARVQREVTLATATAYDLHFRLVPQIARGRLGPPRARRPRAGPGHARPLVGAPAPRPRADCRPLRPGHLGAGPPRARRLFGDDRVVELADVARLGNRVLDEVEKAVIGKRDALELLLLGVLADGHILIEDYPGLAKTLMARSFAATLSLDFSRIQFTPDLMPTDVTGSSIFNQREADFEFRPGPIFANLLLADEINRAPPKTQAALLEAMQERQVTSEGTTRPLGPPFLVLATQNPIEYEGTYPLPEAQLDRFLLRMSVGYPGRDDEWLVLSNRAERGHDEVALEPVLDTSDVARAAAGRRTCPRVGGRRPLHGRHRCGHPLVAVDPGRRLSTRLARVAQAVALPRRARGARLRDA